MQAQILILLAEGQSKAALGSLLASNGYGVSSVDPSSDFLKEISFRTPACIFTDFTVLNGNGGDLISEIRSVPGLEIVPVILLTDKDSSEKQIEAYKAGANLCIAKPFNDEELLVKLHEHLRVWRLQEELAKQLEINQSLIVRLKDDLALGQQVQQSFLPPQQMRTSNFSLEARLIPSGDLSGDYFDYRLITPERLVIFLADVSGHGVASALLAGRLKAFFDENYKRAHRPQFFLEQLNQVLMQLGEHYHIATAVCVFIDVDSTNLVYASAGHRSLYWLDADRQDYKLLPATGPAIGMFNQFEITEETYGLLPGRSRLVCFTDGLIEYKRSSGDWSTEEEFRDSFLLPNKDAPLAEYTELLLESSRKGTPHSRWDDDVSLLVTDF